MTQRYLLIERSSLDEMQAPAYVQVPIQEDTRIKPWITTLAGQLGYPLVDQFGVPIVYRLRPRSGGQLLSTAGRFADVPFPSGSCFVLEPDTYTTIPMHEYARSSEMHELLDSSSMPLRFSRRFLMTSGMLSAFSMLGLGLGMTTAFAQRLLHRQPSEVSQEVKMPKISPSPSPHTFTLSVSRIFTQHQQPVRAVTWSPDEKMLGSGGDDGLALVWQRDGSVLYTLPHRTPLSGFAWSPDGTQLGTGAATTVAFFDAKTGSLLSENTTEHTASVTALGWTTIQATTSFAISAGMDKKAIVWDGHSHQPHVIFRQHTAAIEAIAVLGETAATASQGGVTRVWNAWSGQETHGFFSDTQQSLRAVAFSPTGVLAVGSDDGIIHLWSDGRICKHQAQTSFGMQCSDKPLLLQRHTRSVRAIAFSPAGALLATGGDDGELIIWSVAQAAPLLLLPQLDALAALSWSPSGQFLAGAIGSRVVIWQMQT